MISPTDGSPQTRSADRDTDPSGTAPGHVPAVIRIVLGVTTPAVGLLTAYLWFMGVVTFTGCFIGCGTPEPVLGSGLLLAAVASATGTIVAAWVALSGSTRYARHVGAGAALLASLIAILSVVT